MHVSCCLSAREMFVYTKWYTKNLSVSFNILYLCESSVFEASYSMKTQILLKSPPLEQQRTCMHQCVVCVYIPASSIPPQTAVAPDDFFCRDLAHILINITTASLAILSQLNHASCTTDVFLQLG